MCAAKRHVRFTPNSDRDIGLGLGTHTQTQSGEPF
jgi:hypothetical protein